MATAQEAYSKKQRIFFNNSGYNLKLHFNSYYLINYSNISE